MKSRTLMEELNQNPRTYRLAIVVVLLVWVVAIVAIVGVLSLYLETPSQALAPPTSEPIPEIMIEPAAGPVGSALTVQGRNWPAGVEVMVYLTAPDETTIPVFAVASVSVEPDGQFVATFSLLPETRWQTQKAAHIIAQSEDGRYAAEGRFTILTFRSEPEESPTAEAPAIVEPTAEASPTVEPPDTTAAPEKPTPEPQTAEEFEPLPTPQATATVEAKTPPPTEAIATSRVNLNVRRGPGTNYAIIGALRPGDKATITGSNAEGSWWQIEYLTPAGDRGWISVGYVSTENAANVPIVSVPAPPPTPPTPTPTPAPPPTPEPVITGWRGEYFNNQTLSGPPKLVRDDLSLNFNWGMGSPHAAIPADDFSVRWTRNLPFTEGAYRFHAVVDDGVRFFIDDALVIDSWFDGGAREAVGERWLPWGNHTLRLEYYEHTGEAVIETWWEKISVPGPGGPDANFDADPRSGPVPLKVDFDNESSGDYDDCKWSFGDGDTSTRCRDREHTYDKAGRYTVKLRVRGPGGEDTKERDDYITVRPVARFTASPVSDQPLSVNFTNQSTEHERSEWQFGDGNSSTLENPIYTYAGAGTYSVRLRVKENDVWSDAASHTVTVSGPVNQPPLAVINGPTTGQVGDELTFDALSASDPDANLASFNWNFGDGATAAGLIVSHHYSQSGSYNVVLTVTDSGGLSDTSTYTLQIVEVVANHPLALINGPSSGVVGEAVIFDSGGSYDPDGTIVSYVWDFGDSAVGKLARSAAESTVAHTYQAAGTYQVTLTVTDDAGLSSTAQHPIQVQEKATNQPPVAVINGPDTVMVNQRAIFDSGDSHDPDGTIVSYVWDFGDSAASLSTRSASAGESTMAHVYASPGTYQVTLTVGDNGGLIASAGRSIVVGEPAANQPPAAVIAGPSDGQVGALLTFEASPSSDPDGSLANLSWDFGDGATAGGVTVSHSYDKAGDYSVTLAVTDNQGLGDTTTYSIRIEAPVTDSAIEEQEVQPEAEEEAQRQAEEEAQRQAEAEEEAQRQAEAEAQRQAEAEAQRQAEAEAQRQAEAEAQQQAEAEAQQQAEAEAQRQAEEEAQRQAEAEAQRQAEEEAQRQAEAEAQRQAEEEAQRQAEAEAQRQAEEQAQQQAGELQPPTPTPTPLPPTEPSPEPEPGT